jgi:two-component system cell cycle sensor histidine kinase/response regulator CckA
MPGEGTNAKVYLPAGEIPGAESGPDLHLGGGRRVVVAQPQAALRDIVKKILIAHGYDAVAVTDGGEAIALCRRPEAGIAAAVIDMEMPYMDGPTILRVLRSTNPSLKIILTGGTSEKPPEGAAAVLPRPFSTQNLLFALHNVMDLTP